MTKGQALELVDQINARVGRKIAWFHHAPVTQRYGVAIHRLSERIFDVPSDLDETVERIQVKRAGAKL